MTREPPSEILAAAAAACAQVPAGFRTTACRLRICEGSAVGTFVCGCDFEPLDPNLGLRFKHVTGVSDESSARPA